MEKIIMIQKFARNKTSTVILQDGTNADNLKNERGSRDYLFADITTSVTLPLWSKLSVKKLYARIL